MTLSQFIEEKVKGYYCETGYGVVEDYLRLTLRECAELTIRETKINEKTIENWESQLSDAYVSGHKDAIKILQFKVQKFLE